jgi:hypothetical protein
LLKIEASSNHENVRGNLMKRPFLPIHKILIATFTGISFASFLVAEPSLADLTQPYSTLNSDNNSNPFIDNGSTGFDPLSLMHRAKFGPLNWNPEQQNQQLDDAAAAFRARQNQLLQGQQRQNPNSRAANSDNSQKSVPLITLPASQR